MRSRSWRHSTAAPHPLLLSPPPTDAPSGSSSRLPISARPTGTPHAVRRVGTAGCGPRRHVGVACGQPAREVTDHWSVSRGHAAPGGSPDAEPPYPDPAHRRGRPRAAAAGRVPPDHPLRRLAVVRRGRLPQRLHHDHLHADPAVPARCGVDRGGVALSLWIAYRFRPVFVPVSGPKTRSPGTAP